MTLEVCYRVLSQSDASCCFFFCSETTQQCCLFLAYRPWGLLSFSSSLKVAVWVLVPCAHLQFNFVSGQVEVAHGIRSNSHPVSLTTMRKSMERVGVHCVLHWQIYNTNLMMVLLVCKDGWALPAQQQDVCGSYLKVWFQSAHGQSCELQCVELNMVAHFTL